MNTFRDFIVDKGVLTTTAGVTLGFASVTFIKSFISDIVLPIVFLVIVKGSGKVSGKASSFFNQFLQNKEFRFTNFVSELITWLLIIFSTYLFLDYIVHKYFKKPQTTPPKEQFSAYAF